MAGSGDEVGRAVAKIAVAQICEGIGFHGFQRSAAETLADIALRYLSDLAKAAHFYSNVAGRTECNALDVIMAMEDVSTGSSSATDTSRSVSTSKVLQDFMRYVEFSEEIPFARPLPHFPVAKRRAIPPSFAQLGETPPQPHIPSWLPAFPDPHTYKSTPVWDERKSDPRIDKLEVARQRRKAERSLVSLCLRLSSSGAPISNGQEPVTAQNEPSSSSGRPPIVPTATVFGMPGHGASTSLVPVDFPPSPSLSSRQQWPRESEQASLLSKLESDGQQGKGKGKRVSVGQNPFLASPLPAGEKEVSQLTFTGKSADQGLQIREVEGKVALPSVLDTFSSAIEATKQGLESGDPASERRGNSILDVKERRPVLMSFDWGRNAQRKALSAQLSIGALQRFPTVKDKGKAVSSGKDDDKDDRKRRAEQILSQSYLEGADDVAQS